MSLIERAKILRQKIESLSEHMTDEESLQNPELIPVWKADTEYKTGQRVTHNSIVYKVLSDHVSQQTWTPPNTPSLYAKVLIPSENEIPQWEQPDSTNAYMKGDKVIHLGKTWESEVDGNVWEPSVYGWKEVAL